MATPLYTQGRAPIVTVYGVGNLHHLTYDSHTNGGTVFGMLPTTSESTTNFLLGFSQNYGGYAFYWDGEGEAFWRVGLNSTERLPVGTSWQDATSVWFGESPILGVNVEADVAAAGNGGEGITVYYVPNDLD
ncbi:hypothetical protein B0H16DRAFT_1686673 [Mycena metata]|uniref:Uncharacterized protein n=1 Tax=Mycena metata TaxID=1033252 RepID=A0AAD7JPZ8_9AGAR|nr:hypothetical protein B0H16DRAFT_1686673 [Mycena metata]